MTVPLAQDLEVRGYSIVRKIDEGGMGEVFEAWQEGPVRRRVAIKLVKRGMDSEEVVARFESERQALALMNHAHIAQVYTAGTTSSGRPYFVMEYVDGVPVTSYCDRERLDLAARIELFLGVCAGVQHAHQKGIIHRDIKASNVLVEAEAEGGRPLPKIIDFGLAKALSKGEAPEAGLTQAGTPLGTPEYMSPEQLDLETANIDTRTDVYALGILLYELVVGSRPFDARVIVEEGFFEFRRRILEVDAPRPSTRTTDDTARFRNTTAVQLERRLRGDLDWIIGRALEKLPDRRYPSVSEFAADLERHLANEPVVAGPPSGAYRVRKFVRRHRLAVASAAALVLALGLGVTGTSVALVRAVRAEDLASREADRATQEAHTARRTADFLVDLFEVVDPGEARGNSVTAREILDRGATRIEAELREEPEVRATLMDTMGVVYTRLGLYRSALPLLSGALAERTRTLGPESERVAESRNHLGTTLRLSADFEGAERELRQALELRRRLLGRHPAVAESLQELGAVLADRGAYAEAEVLHAEALELRRELLGRHPDVAASLNDLAFARFDQKHVAGVEELLREALELRRELLGAHPATAESLNNLGTFLYEEHRQEEAIPLLREALEQKREFFGSVHPEVATSMNNLAFALHDAGDLGGAEELYREAVEQQRALLGEAHPSLGQALNNLAFVLHDRGDYDGARRSFFEAIVTYRGALGDDHPSVENAVSNARRLVGDELARRESTLGPDDPRSASARSDMAELTRLSGRPAEARADAEDAWIVLSDPAHAESELGARAGAVLGAVLADLGEADVAAELLEEAIPRLAATQPPESHDLRVSCERLARLHEENGRPDAAARVRALAALPPEK